MVHTQLGPFSLLDVLGTGGMGQVWRGEHLEQRVSVAVKVMHGQGSRRSAFVESFHREARAVARMNHPGIVRVFDYGTVSEETAAGSGGHLQEDTPYLVMELAQGTLTPWCGLVDWEKARQSLLSILAALGHAHARGVTHRDLKPANVLLGGLDEGLKLADFGLAAHQEGAADGMPTGGTPSYMAPEQIQGRWRDFGPWTDLYALGCLTHTLLSGQAPFHGEPSLARAHLSLPPPLLRARTPTPEGLQGWVARLLQKRPGDRFQRAADAAAALADLGGLVQPARAAPQAAWPQAEGTTNLWQPSSDGASAPSLTSAWIPELSGVEIEQSAVDSSWFSASPVPTRPAITAPAPPVLTEGALPAPAAPSAARLHGVGLGLYGLREVAMIGRGEARRVMWEALERVSKGGHSEAVVLRGSAGVGKSRLARWFTERAHEVGAAHILSALHGSPPGPSDGLAPMVSRWMQCGGLARPAVAERVRERFPGAPPEAVGALTELIKPLKEGESLGGVSPVALRTEAARHGTLDQAVALMGRTRRVVVWLDDVQWGSEALSWCKAHLSGKTSGTLFVLTVRQEGLPASGGTRQALDQLCAMPCAQDVPIDALSETEHAMLVSDLLGLRGDIATGVVDRTGGNPLFAVHLVGDWVERGILVPSPEGFVTATGATLEIPDAIHGLWTQRIDTALLHTPPGTRAALEIAAVLGAQVNHEEWAESCQEAGVDLPGGLLEVLQRQGLAEEDDTGWSFAHGMLAESVVRMALDGDRLLPHQAAAGAVLFRRGDALRNRSEYPSAERVLSRALAILDGSADTHKRTWIRALTARAQSLVWLSQTDEAVDIFNISLSASRSARMRQTEALALLGLGTLYNRQGIPDKSLESYQGAITVLSSIGNRHNESMARANMSLLLRRLGRLEEAHTQLETALRLSLETNNEAAEAIVISEKGDQAMKAGRYGEAMEYYTRARDIYEASNRRSFSAFMSRSIALILMKDEKHDQAESMLLASQEIMADLGMQRAEANVVFNLGVLCINRGQFSKAMRHFERALALNLALKNRRGEGFSRLGLGSILVLQGNLTSAHTQLSRSLELFEEIGNKMLAIRARVQLGELYLEQGELNRARPLLEAAIESGEAFEMAIQVASARMFLARLLAREGHTDEALPLIDSAGESLGRLGQVSELGALHCARAEIARLSGDAAAAEAALQAAAESTAGTLGDMRAAFAARIQAERRALAQTQGAADSA